jgi:L-threonylcarbamoyladenylate synthase
MKDKLFIYPTDTVWGIGGSIYSELCYKKIAEIKQRDALKPLSVLFPSIEEIVQFVNFPKEFTAVWLSRFFELESTLGVPKEWIKEEVPEWVCQGSPFLAIRCVPTEPVKKLFSIINDPISSTSLNFAGEEPIVDNKKAEEFFNNLPSKEEFISNEDSKCSGRSSTIVLLKKDGPFLVRSGLYAKEINEHLKLLST